MTLPDRCPLCGGAVIDDGWGGKCAGFCGLPIPQIESLSPDERRVWIRAMNRREKNAPEIEPRGDVL